MNEGINEGMKTTTFFSLVHTRTMGSLLKNNVHNYHHYLYQTEIILSHLISWNTYPMPCSLRLFMYCTYTINKKGKIIK